MAAAIEGKILLTNMAPGQEGKICEIKGGRKMARRLEALGLRLGKKIKKVSSIFNRGPVILDINGRMIAIGHGQAGRIFVMLELEKGR